jgi:hypothetical protein
MFNKAVTPSIGLAPSFLRFRKTRGSGSLNSVCSQGCRIKSIFYPDPPHKILYPILSRGCQFCIKHKIGGSTSSTSFIRAVHDVHASCSTKKWPLDAPTASLTVLWVGTVTNHGFSILLSNSMQYLLGSLVILIYHFYSFHYFIRLYPLKNRSPILCKAVFVAVKQFSSVKEYHGSMQLFERSRLTPLPSHFIMVWNFRI